jgi:hypothetical protein
MRERSSTIPALHLARQIAYAPGARNALFVAKQRTLYVAVPVQQSAPAEIRVYTVK